MMIGVPMEELGIEYYDRVNIEFKIADSRSIYETMEQFYEDGDSAPLGRMNFAYQTYVEGVSENVMTPVVKAAERADYAKNEPDITPKHDPAANTGKKINGWLIGAGAALVAVGVVIAAVVLIRRKKSNG